MGCKQSKKKGEQPVEDDVEKMPEKKVVLIGDSGVGKSSIIYSLLSRDVAAAPNIGVKDYYIVRDVPGGIGGKPAKIRLVIWDTAGEESQRQQTKSCYNNADAVLIIYAIDNRDTYKSIDNYVESVDEICPKNTIKVIVGNKCDLDNSRKVKTSELDKTADECDANLKFETSALKDYKSTIDAMFDQLV